MLSLDRAVRDAIVAHARRDHPDEACGVVAGAEGSDRPTRFIPMINAERSPTFYIFDSGELLRLYRDMEAREEEPVVVYHSHTATEAYPSRTDISYASEPNAHYVLVSTRDEGAGDDEIEFRSFRIVDGVVTEEPVTVLDPATPTAPTGLAATATASVSVPPAASAPAVSAVPDDGLAEAGIERVLLGHTPAEVVYDCR